MKTIYNKKLDKLLKYFINEVSVEFSFGEINDTNEIYEHLHEYCNEAVKFYIGCQQILENNLDYCFFNDATFGKPKDVYQAAFVCLYNFIQESAEFSDMYKEIEEELEKV